MGILQPLYIYNKFVMGMIKHGSLFFTSFIIFNSLHYIYHSHQLRIFWILETLETLETFSLLVLCPWEILSAFWISLLKSLCWSCSAQAELNPPGGVIYLCLHERRRV